MSVFDYGGRPQCMSPFLGEFSCAVVIEDDPLGYSKDEWGDVEGGGMSLTPTVEVLFDQLTDYSVNRVALLLADKEVLLTYISTENKGKIDPVPLGHFVDPEDEDPFWLYEFSLNSRPDYFGRGEQEKFKEFLKKNAWFAVIHNEEQGKDWENFYNKYMLEENLAYKFDFFNTRYANAYDKDYLTVYFFNPVK